MLGRVALRDHGRGDGGLGRLDRHHVPLDYYNSKPPLHIWLVALSFKVLGPGLVSLRLPAMVAAWLTVGVLMWWASRAVGVMAGLILATSYGFLYVHSGRSGNSDAHFTLPVLLTVVTLWAARDRPRRGVWLAPSSGWCSWSKAGAS